MLYQKLPRHEYHAEVIRPRHMDVPNHGPSTLRLASRLRLLPEGRGQGLAPFAQQLEELLCGPGV